MQQRDINPRSSSRSAFGAPSTSAAAAPQQQMAAAPYSQVRSRLLGLRPPLDISPTDYLTYTRTNEKIQWILFDYISKNVR